MNQNNICLFAAGTMESGPFLTQFLEENGVEEAYFKNIDWTYQKDALMRASNINEVKIPKVIHYVWFTNPLKEREMTDVARNIEEVETSVAALNQHGFSYNLWVNGEAKLNKTREWAESLGMKIRDIEELRGDDALANQALDVAKEYIADKQFAAAADVTRVIIVHKQGGVYIDGDQVVWQYDPILNNLDFFMYAHPYSGVYMIENSMIASTPNNAILRNLLEDIVDRKINKKKVFESECLNRSFYTALAETGPIRLTFAYNKALEEGFMENKSYIILHDKLKNDDCNQESHDYEYCSKLDRNTPLPHDQNYDLKFITRHFGAGTWFDFKKDLKNIGRLRDIAEN
ncbi:UNKNOWN [Stylonychia lemnae]|uniref:Uncharacterized protein n=1 Tax=Stylonychia lemnae TaxID=5949 RepID=A0A078AN02_STYLE|nr:UNKNOWN [Stylonychia lemnae]|eukprot:CDW83311.1 UNKNOWN [Stylonychia lemnae]